MTKRLRLSIIAIEDWMLNANIGSTILFTLADDVPLMIDVSVQDENGIEEFGDLNFTSFEQALIAIGDSQSMREDRSTRAHKKLE